MTPGEHSARATSRLLLALLVVSPAIAAEHPITLLRFGDCSPCHTSKTSGKSVHSAMALSCAVCHTARTQGDTTTIDLTEPKEKICFACHQQSAQPRLHASAVKGDCMDCHDAHSSSRPMLLREKPGVHPLPRKGQSRTASRRPRSSSTATHNP